MGNWRDKISEKMAEIDLWAIDRVNQAIDGLTDNTDRAFEQIKDKAKSQVEKVGDSALKEVEKTKQKVQNLTRSAWKKFDK